MFTYSKQLAKFNAAFYTQAVEFINLLQVHLVIFARTTKPMKMEPIWEHSSVLFLLSLQTTSTAVDQRSWSTAANSRTGLVSQSYIFSG